MLTAKQEEWIAHLSDSDKIRIIPFDSDAERKFQKVKSRIQQFLGENMIIEHCGATSLGISGQDEIDVYILVSPKDFNRLIEPLTENFGEPRSLYSMERARFVTEEDGKRIDVFLINEESEGWRDGVRFESYLKTHPEVLEKYRNLKEDGNGMSVSEYYRKKVEFINDILMKCDSE
jgi:GrpB-like predicted nucleotidyltransferase (UPF0157 family)